MNCDQAKEVGPAIMYKMVGQEIIQTLCSSYYHGQGQAASWKTAGLRSPGSVQQANFISKLVLTSGGGDGLPISLTKIMGYELSQFPASLFETKYLMLATNKPQIIQMHS